jgi:thioredoxin-related protein
VQVTGRHCIISCYVISCYLAAVSCCCAFACDVNDDTNCPAAVALARKSNRPLLLAFLGTDWSISSLKLDREVFDRAEFADDAKYNFLLCKIHFYQTQERAPDLLVKNQQLAEKFHVEQFPTVIVLSPNGVELGRLGYVAGGVEKFAAAVNEIIIRKRDDAKAK